MKTIGSVVLCVMVACGTASAATLGPLSCTGVPAAGMSAVDFSGELHCPQFNVAGGTLTSIVLELTGSITGSISLTNTDTTTQYPWARIETYFLFEPPAGFPAWVPVAPSFDCGPLWLDAGQSGGCHTAVPVSASDTVTNTSILAPYIGGSTFAIPLWTLTVLTTEGGEGYVTANWATLAAARATVTFEYQPQAVPEPTTLLLVGIGLVSLGRRWRR